MVFSWKLALPLLASLLQSERDEAASAVALCADRGCLRPIIVDEFPLQEAKDAHMAVCLHLLFTAYSELKLVIYHRNQLCFEFHRKSQLYNDV